MRTEVLHFEHAVPLKSRLGKLWILAVDADFRLKYLYC